MSILLNGAGGSAADPILHGLGLNAIAGSSTFDVDEVVDAWMDQSAGFPGTTSVKASLSPAATVLTAGNAATYTQSTGRFAITSTTGLSVGDYIYISGGGTNAGLYRIATIPVANNITLEGTHGLSADASGISYQVAWRYPTTAGGGATVSSGGGTQNFWKFRAEDSGNNQTNQSDSFYIRTAPSGASYVAIAGQSYTGVTISDATPSLEILSGWAAAGGVSHVELDDHSTQTVNHFRWGDTNDEVEKTLSAAESAGFQFTGGDGQKYGRLLLKSRAGGTAVGVDMDLMLDTGGPTIVLSLAGN